MSINGQPLNVFKRSFINYFSLGYDARVGFGFEKKRSGNRCWNKCIYFWEGCKKNCCMKTIPLTSFIHSFQVFDSTQLEENCDQKELVNNPDKNLNTKEENIKIDKEVNMNECFENSELFEKYARRKSKVYFRTPNITPHQDNQGCMYNFKS
jgi:hypothetical protein